MVMNGLVLAAAALCVSSATGLQASSPTAAASAPGSKVVFKNLSPDTFRHPLDRAQTAVIRNSPLSGPVEAVIRKRVLPLVEEGVQLDNLANSVRVSPSQLPDLYGLLEEACSVLDMPSVPDLFVKQNPAPNAYTMAMNGDKPFIVVHSSLLDLCDAAETQAILAHELGHLKCEHGIWLTLGNLANAGAANVPLLGEALDAALRSQLQEWQRAAEFSCDRAALLVAQDPAIVNSALLKLVGGGGAGVASGSGGAGLSGEAFLKQAEDYEAALLKASRPVRASMTAMNAPRTHPLPVKRVAELDRWAKSGEFHGIIARAKLQTRT